MLDTKKLSFAVVIALILVLALGLYKSWRNSVILQEDLEKMQHQYNLVYQENTGLYSDKTKNERTIQRILSINGNFQQVASNIIHLDGIQQFYRGMYAMCLIKNGVAQGVQPDPAVLNGCQTEVEAHMNKNLHQFVFKKLVGWRVPKGFNFKIPPAEVVVPLLPFKNLDPTKQFEPDVEPEQQEGPIPAPTLPEKKHKGAGVGA